MRVEHGDPQGRRFIVAEISKTWSECQEDQRHVRELFEECIEFNLARGYRLHSWSLAAAAYSLRTWPRPEHQPDVPHHHDNAVQETIVAVFERIEP